MRKRRAGNRTNETKLATVLCQLGQSQIINFILRFAATSSREWKVGAGSIREAPLHSEDSTGGGGGINKLASNIINSAS